MDLHAKKILREPTLAVGELEVLGEFDEVTVYHFKKVEL